MKFFVLYRLVSILFGVMFPNDIQILKRPICFLSFYYIMAFHFIYLCRYPCIIKDLKQLFPSKFDLRKKQIATASLFL
jgi:hypothetical protein